MEQREMAMGNKWISVEERLPEVGQPVLLYAGEGDLARAYRFGFWCGNAFEYAQLGPDDIDAGFTHWMPLPDAPGEK